ncbi:MAG TPA: class I SAM-dependent methyltransferase [Taishania sp.]|nr:class I SAM-dependent methyltransferase [Taishania sp.]HNS41436.1 class I SAM-dependent methyltransferase [Taishania sp.]
MAVNEQDKKEIKNLISQLKNNHSTIQIADFGAGSKKLNNERKISSILKISSSKGKYARFFYQLAAYYQPQQVLEFGTSLGIGTLHFAKGNPSAQITTVEACPQTAQVAQQNFEQLQLKNINLVNTTFQDFLDNTTLLPYDVIFIDGHHDGVALSNYVDMLFPYMKDDTFVILDDIRWSNFMFESWQKLTQDNRFHVSIDLMRMGILLKRPQQRKEHFTIRL